MAGLPSLIFHLSDGGGGALDVVGGGEAVGRYLGAVNTFVSRRYPVVSVRDVNAEVGKKGEGEGGYPLLHDSRATTRYSGWGGGSTGKIGVRVWGVPVPVPLLPQQQACSGAAVGESAGGVVGSKRPRSDPLLPPQQQQQHQQQPPTPVVCYLVALTGPPPPPSPPSLSGGGSTPVGEVVTRCFAVIDLPHPSLAPPTRLALDALVASLGEIPSPTLFVHMSSGEVTSSPLYAQHLLPADEGKEEGGSGSGSGSLQIPRHVLVQSQPTPRATGGGIPEIASCATSQVTTHFPGATKQTIALHAQSPTLYPLLLPRPTLARLLLRKGDADGGGGERGGVVMEAFPLESWDMSPSALPASAATAAVNTANTAPSTVNVQEVWEEEFATGPPPGSLLTTLPLNHPTSSSAEKGVGSVGGGGGGSGGEANKGAARALRALLLPPPPASAPPAPIPIPSATTESATSCPPIPPTPAPNNKPFVLFLGTGAAAPSKLRSCSALYVSLGVVADAAAAANAAVGGGDGLQQAPKDSLSPGLLLDAGEGALGKLLLEPYPSQGALSGSGDYGSRVRSVLLGLRLVWISHMHADHHTGLLTLLWAHSEARWKAMRAGYPPPPPLLVAGPPTLERVLTVYGGLVEGEWWARVRGFETHTDHRCQQQETSPPPSPHFLFMNSCGGSFGDQAILTALQSPPQLHAFMGSGSGSSSSRSGNFPPPSLPPPTHLLPVSFHGIPVEHSPCALGCSIGFSVWGGGGGSVQLSYSGDTRPCQSFVEGVVGVGRALGSLYPPLRASTLVHEATFTGEKSGEAVTKRHSTVEEAVGVASRVHCASPVTLLLLTHFSQRYASHGDLERGGGVGEAGEDKSGGGEAASKGGTTTPLPATPFPVILASDLLRVPL